MRVAPLVETAPNVPRRCHPSVRSATDTTYASAHGNDLIVGRDRNAQVIGELTVSGIDPSLGCDGRNGRGQATDDLRKREIVFRTGSRCAMRSRTRPASAVSCLTQFAPG